MNKLKPYPIWVCCKCAYKAGAYKSATFSEPHISTFHTGICDVCGEETEVTEPRDFGYPNFKGFERGK